MKQIKKHQQVKIYIEKNKIACIIKEGIIGIKSLSYAQIQNNEIESARKYISKFTKRNCKLWIRVKSNVFQTKKSIGARMGKGIGAFDKCVYNLKKGTIIFELFYSTIISKIILEKALTMASKKLSVPVKTYQKKIKGI